MNHEAWNALTTKLAEREQAQTQVEHLQATIEQLGTEIDELAASLGEQLTQLRAKPE